MGAAERVKSMRNAESQIRLQNSEVNFTLAQGQRKASGSFGSTAIGKFSKIKNQLGTKAITVEKIKAFANPLLLDSGEIKTSNRIEKCVDYEITI